MASGDRLPASRTRPTGAGSLRAHWRGFTAALLIGVATAGGIAGGWANEHERLWWVLGAGICAAVATLLPLLPPPSPRKPEQVWNIPAPVRNFTGREPDLRTLRARLTKGGTDGRISAVALHGMGGVGKTQLARAYAHQYRDHYQVGWWIAADSPVAAAAALGTLAAALGLPDGLPLDTLVARLSGALAERQGWLLVFDSATDSTDLEPLLPAAADGHVLVTSRNQAWHGLAEPVPVEVLGPDAAVRLLQQRSGDPDRDAAAELATQLGCLPLALEQAAAYAEQQHLALSRYVKLFRQRRHELLDRGRPLAYNGTVAATFTLALDRLAQTNPAALQLLELCALLAPDELPVDLILAESHLLPSPLAEAVADPVAKSETLAALYQASLLAAEVDDTARLHRLVQTIVLDRISEADRRERIDQAVAVLSAVIPADAEEPKDLARWARLVAHAQAVIDHASRERYATPEFARLLLGVACYLRNRGLSLTMARKFDEQALETLQDLYQGDHRDVATSLASLALDLHRLGQVERARALDEQALAMRRRLHRGDHPDIADSLGDLANDWRASGRLEQARQLNEQALAMRQRLYRGDHPDIAHSLGNVAIDLQRLGDAMQARARFGEALAMRRRLYDGDHPYIATDLANLAVAEFELRRVERALDLDEQALAMFRRLYDGDHPEIAASLANLAVFLREQGQLERALDLDEQALAMFRRLYDGDHPEIAASLANLARDLHALGQAAQAQELEAQVSAIHRRLQERDGSQVTASDAGRRTFLRGLGQVVRAQAPTEPELAEG
jgi:tetratricopeptide (TPR) repeat protein